MLAKFWFCHPDIECAWQEEVPMLVGGTCVSLHGLKIGCLWLLQP